MHDFVPAVLAVLAAAAPPIDPTGGLLSYGVLGVVVVLLISGLLVPGYLWKRAEDENDRLRRLIDDKVYPAIEASTCATREVVELMKELAQHLRDAEREAYRDRTGPNPRGWDR